MTMIYKYILVALTTFLLSHSGNAQYWATSLTYDIGIPFSDVSDFSDETSFRGVSVDARRFINDNISAGLYVGWHVFKGREDGLFSVDGTDISGTRVNYVNTFPIMATGYYHFGEDDGGVRPYAGIGLGTVHALKRTEIGLFAIQDNDWRFGFFPGVGVMIPLGVDVGVNLGAKYQYSIGPSDSFDITYLSFNIGLYWTE